MTPVGRFHNSLFVEMEFEIIYELFMKKRFLNLKEILLWIQF